jgi:putative holliday junction resolvase
VLNPQIVVAFDFGLRRIGVASGDTLTHTAAPRTTVANLNGTPDWSAIDRLLKDLVPNILVVGSPYNDDGTTGAIGAQADAFAAKLVARYGLPVQRTDERYSSLAAQSLLREQRQSGQRTRTVKKGDVDSAAAAIMLTSWLEQPNAMKEPDDP